MNTQIAKLSGWLLFLSILLSVFSSVTHYIASFWAGIPVWISAMLFFPFIKKNQKKQVFILLIVGATGLFTGLINHVDPAIYLKALEANQKVITMLIAVGFLKILLSGSKQKQGALPKGRKALLNTLLSAHLFGSVLNMSSVIIVGDRLAKQQAMSPVQGLLLLRAFCICAFWSPFFAAMGLTLVSSPGSQLSTLVLYGIPVSLAGIAISAWEILKQPVAKELHGYPIALESLWMPCLLALIVICCHEWAPGMSVLTLVSVTALTFTLLWLLMSQRSRSVQSFIHHIETGIAGSSGEVVLFAAAALLASGVAALLISLDIHIALAHFGYIQAGVTLLVLIILAMTGMHPVTSVALAGSILAPTVNDPNLLGITLLMGWSLGIALSPFSGVQLSIQSRYQISAQSLLRLNWRYALIMYTLCLLLLWFYTTQH